MKTLSTWVNHAVQYVSSRHVLHKLVQRKESLIHELSGFFKTILDRLSLKSKTERAQASSNPVEPKESSFKKFLTFCSTIVLEFQEKHNSVQSVVVGLGIILSPSYIFSGKFFNLLDVIQGMANGYHINLLPFIRLVFETLIFFYFLWLIVSFFLARSRSDNHSLKFEGIHPAVSLTYINMHLLAGETIKPGQDEETVKNLYEGIPSVHEFVNDKDEGYQAIKGNSTLMEVIDLMYPMEERVEAKTKPKVKTLLELLNEDDPAPEDEIQAFLTTLNQ